MNFLAHLYLSEPTAAHRIGNLMPDMVRGRLPDDLPTEVDRGVRMHRRIDAFTDCHPVVSRSKARLRPRQGRFAGILIDVFYDHFLASDWPRWSTASAMSYTAYTQAIHQTLSAHDPCMPPTMRRIVNRMIDQNWLGSYASVQGMELTLARMSVGLTRRLGRPVNLRSAGKDLCEHYDALAEDFAEFFPALIEHVNHRPTSGPTLPTPIQTGPGEPPSVSRSFCGKLQARPCS